MNKSWTLCLGALLLCALFVPAQAASDATLKKYAEAVDFLDRWTGDRQVLDAAHDRLTELLLDEPAFAPAHVELARWYLMNSRNHASALKSLARAEALEPEFAGTYVLRGYVLHQQGKNEEALVELDRAEALGTDNPWLQLNRGFALEELGRGDEALPLFRKVFEENLEDPKAWPSAKFELIEAYTERGLLDAIEKVHQRALELKPTDASQVLAYAEWLSERRRFDDAIAVMRTRPAVPTGPELEFALLQLLSGKAVDLQSQSPDSEAARAAFAEMRDQAETVGVSEMPSFEEWSAQVREYLRTQIP